MKNISNYNSKKFFLTTLFCFDRFFKIQCCNEIKANCNTKYINKNVLLFYKSNLFDFVENTCH